jgi:hypothetical protein
MDFPTDLQPVESAIPEDLQPMAEGKGADIPSASGVQHLNPEQAAKYYAGLQTTAMGPSSIESQNAQRGTLASNAIELLRPGAELMARAQHLLSPVVGEFSPNMAANMETSARQLETTRGNGGVSSLPGQLIGSAVKYANPLVAAGLGGNEAYSEDQYAKEEGAQIGTGAEAAHVIGQAAIDGIMGKIFQGKPGGGSVMGVAEKKLAGYISQVTPQYIAKYGAKAAVGAMINDGAMLAQQALAQQTTQPDTQIGQGLGMNTLIGAGIPVVHEAAGNLLQRMRGQAGPSAETPGVPTPAAQVPADLEPVTQAETPVAPTPAEEPVADRIKSLKERLAETQKQLATENPTAKAEAPAADLSKAEFQTPVEATKETPVPAEAQGMLKDMRDRLASTDRNVERRVSNEPVQTEHRFEPGDQAEFVSPKELFTKGKQSEIGNTAEAENAGTQLAKWDQNLAPTEPGLTNAQKTEFIKNGLRSETGPMSERPFTKAVTDAALTESDARQQREAQDISLWRPESPEFKRLQAERIANGQPPYEPSKEPSFFDKIKEQGAAKIKELASNEEGGSDIHKKFIHEDVIPAIQNAGEAISKITHGLKNVFGAQGGPGAEEGKGMFRKRGAELAQRMDQIHDQFGKAENALDRLPQDQQRTFTDLAERGALQADPKLQSLADDIRDIYDGRLADIQQRDPEFKGLSDYMGHAFKDVNKAKMFLDQFAAKKPLAGNKSFTKGRAYTFQSDAIAAGLEPVTDNPVTMMKLKVLQMDKWITAHDLGEEMETRGHLKQMPKDQRPPDGWAIINDPMFRGKMAPEGLASVFNNALSTGLRGHKDFGPAIRGVFQVGNLMNQVNLGLSGRHALTSTLNSGLSEFALGLKQAIAGEPIKGMQKMALGTTAIGPAARDYWNGTSMLKEWLHPGSTDAQTKVIVDAMKEQGGRAKMDDFYHSGMTDKMMKAFHSGNIIGAALRLPGAAFDTVAKPIMEYMVPRLKMGAFMQQAKLALESNPSMDGEQLSHAMGKAWQSIDNRFGEIVHDNLFWHQTTRDLALMSFRSVGWNQGTVNELLGGMKDIKDVSKSDKGGLNISHRLAYAATIPILTGLWGGLMHYAMSGQKPSQLKDLYYPKTGSKNPQGDDERVELPTYMNDVFSAAHSPLSTVTSKLHPLVGTTMDLMTNKDFTGTHIASDDDPWLKRQMDRIKYVGKQVEPISVQQYNQQREGGDTPFKSLMGAAGINKAPARQIRSDAENAIEDKLADKATSRTPDEADHSRLMAKLVGDLRNKHEDAWDSIHAAEEKGSIDQDDVQSIAKRAEKPGGLEGLILDRNLGPKDIMDVWEKMTPDEKKETEGAVRHKIGSAKKLLPADRINFFHQINTDMKD